MTRGKTTLLVTHDTMEALRLGHRIIILGSEPARVVSRLEFSSPPPREPDNPEVVQHYGPLLKQLLREEW